MNIEEIERIANEVMRCSAYVVSEVSERPLARAVLAMLPLCREAELWQRQIIGERTSYDLRLEAAIDAMRAAMEGKS